MRKQVVSYGCLALVLALALSLAPATFAQGKVAETIQVNAKKGAKPAGIRYGIVIDKSHDLPLCLT